MFINREDGTNIDTRLRQSDQLMQLIIVEVTQRSWETLLTTVIGESIKSCSQIDDKRFQ